MSNPNGNPSTLLRLGCLITGGDPEIAGQSNPFDRRTIMRHALALLCILILETVLWSAVLANRLPLAAAIALGLLIGMFIFLIDQSIGAGDWELRGILRARVPLSLHDLGGRLRRGWSLLLRLLLAAWLALVTGENVTLWWYAPTIDHRLQVQRTVQNQPIRKEYDAHKEMAAQPLRAAQQELAAAQEERIQLQRRMQQAASARDDAVTRASAARIDMVDEEIGRNRVAGRGVRFRGAQRQEQEANHLLALAERNLTEAQARFKDIEERIGRLDQTLAERQREFEAKLKAIDEQMQHDPRYIPGEVDYLGRASALQEIQNDPATGGVAARDYWLFTGALVILELAFIFITQVGAPPSVYTLRLIARTRLEAQQVDAEFVRNLRNLGDGQFDNPAPPQADAGGGLSAPAMQDAAAPLGTDAPAEEPLFDPPPAQPAADTPLATERRPDTREAPGAERYEVIGGAPGERVSTAEAVSDPNRYWVNPDRPSEIWDRRHRNALFGLG